MTSLDTNCRTLIVSQRERSDGFGRQPAYVSFLEAEEVLAVTVGADVVTVAGAPTDARVRARRLAGRQLRRLSHSGQRLPAVLPGRAPIETPRDHYDIGVFVGFTAWDLPLLERMPEIRQRCDRLIAWFPEVWASDLEDPTARYEPFDLVDHLFVGTEGAEPALAGLTNSPVRFMAMAADVTRFAPTVSPQPRPIDVLGIGRRDPHLHECLLGWSQKASKLYVYDTMSGAKVPDPTAHRVNLGDTYSRTSIALTNFAKHDLPEVTRGDREIPSRLYEGLAAGALMVGHAPDEERQRRVVGRPVVVDIPNTPSEAVELISDLNEQDLEAERVANVCLAMRRHDWTHRWRDIYEAVGAPVPIGLSARIDNLAAMSAALDPTR